MKTKLSAVFFLLCTAAASGKREELPGLDFEDPELRENIQKVILTEAKRVDMDPLLVVAVMRVESGFDTEAKSKCGAYGLMQVRLATAHWVAKKEHLADTAATDPEMNVRIGIRYLAYQIQRFGDISTALIAYNAGPKRAHELLQLDEIPQRFLDYPEKVEAEYLRLKGIGFPNS